MGTIIAARMQTQDDVADAIEMLVADGFTAEKTSSFFVNPAGQHDAYALGGDHDKSAGAEASGSGVATGMTGGGLVGALVGVAGVAIAGPIGPVIGALVGAHSGGLVGAMSSMKEEPQSDMATSLNDYQKMPRRSGMLVAVEIQTMAEETRAIDLLQRIGAEDVERADGTITDGGWTDFDPLSPSMLVPGQPASTLHVK